jgi:hypothetical protein
MQNVSRVSEVWQHRETEYNINRITPFKGVVNINLGRLKCGAIGMNIEYRLDIILFPINPPNLSPRIKTPKQNIPPPAP